MNKKKSNKIEITEEIEIDLFTALSFQVWDIENDQSVEKSARWKKFYKQQQSVKLKK